MTKSTSQMNAIELARVWAEHFGYTARTGGWIYRPDGTPVVQGWDMLAKVLTSRKFVVVGQGINWRASGERPVLPRGGW